MKCGGIIVVRRNISPQIPKMKKPLTKTKPQIPLMMTKPLINLKKKKNVSLKFQIIKKNLKTLALSLKIITEN